MLRKAFAGGGGGTRRAPPNPPAGEAGAGRLPRLFRVYPERAEGLFCTPIYPELIKGLFFARATVFNS